MQRQLKKSSDGCNTVLIYVLTARKTRKFYAQAQRKRTRHLIHRLCACISAVSPSMLDALIPVNNS